MKKTILILIASLQASMIMAQECELGLSFQYVKPLGGMAQTINNGFGVVIDGAYNFKKPFSLGMEFSYTGYGQHREKQTYTFDDETITETYVNISNYFMNLNITGKHFIRNGKNINPYLSGKLGYSWYRTLLTIEDPEDETNCHPLESDILAKDGTFIATGGGGVRLDFSAVFKNFPSNRLFLDFNAHITQGGRVKYMNVDHKPKVHNQSDVTAKFINTQTQVVHEHHVGYLYTSIVNMMEYRLSFIFKPAN